MQDDSLEKIAEEVRACRKCEIGSTRTQGVPGQGNPNARLVFVGEAPGADEDREGLAFIGRAGQLLTKIIKGMSLTRDDVFITNIVKSRPVGFQQRSGPKSLSRWERRRHERC